MVKRGLSVRMRVPLLISTRATRPFSLPGICCISNNISVMFYGVAARDTQVPMEFGVRKGRSLRRVMEVEGELD